MPTDRKIRRHQFDLWNYARAATATLCRSGGRSGGWSWRDRRFHVRQRRRIQEEVVQVLNNVRVPADTSAANIGSLDREFFLIDPVPAGAHRDAHNEACFGYADTDSLMLKFYGWLMRSIGIHDFSPLKPDQFFGNWLRYLTVTVNYSHWFWGPHQKGLSPDRKGFVG